MQSLPYSQLNQSQLDQVAYLFADKQFGTDAVAFVYELTEAGQITGRTPIHIDRSPGRAKQNAPVKVIAVREVHVTEEQIKQAQMYMDALAAFVAREMYQPINVEQEISL
jgi:hypothetical protein